MPAYVLPLANALNGIQMHEPRHEEIALFTAPSIRILVVDDIVTNLKVMKGLLAPYQCSVDLCAKGAQAVKIISNEYYDIVFMDHMMPDMDGIEATQKIRMLPVDYAKTVCIIALTANALSGMRELFLQNGFDDYLAKPIEISKLNEIMERWIPQNRRLPSENPNHEPPSQEGA
jgi:CheY-like chemotaxis protein